MATSDKVNKNGVILIWKKVFENMKKVTGAVNYKTDGDLQTQVTNVKSAKLDKTGDSKDNTATFTAATTRANIASGEKHSVMFGKIAKFFADLKTVAFTGSYSDLSNRPTLGTAAAKNIPSTGNAGNDQVVMGNDSRLADARTPISHTHTKTQITDFPASMPASDVYNWAKQSTKPTYTASEVGAIASTLKGATNGVAELDSTGKVPSSQLPSFVDDVIEGYLYNGKFYKEAAHTTVITGESGKIYTDLSTNKTYRWSGSAYTVISDTITLGETSTTAYRGDRGKIAYDHSKSGHAPSNAQANVQSDWNATSGDAYIKNKPSIGAAAAKGVVTSVDTSANLPTANAVKTFVEGKGYLTSHQDISGKLDKTGNAQDNTVTYTSSDVADGSATAWTSVTKLSSGEKLSSIFAKMSQMFKNVRFLYKMLGTTDISAIGDGTVRGAISALNSNCVITHEPVSNANANDYTHTGIYYLNTGNTNIPINYCVLLVMGLPNGNNCIQLAISIVESDSKLLWRKKNGSNWYSWRYVTGNLVSQ